MFTYVCIGCGQIYFNISLFTRHHTGKLRRIIADLQQTLGKFDLAMLSGSWFLSRTGIIYMHT